MRAIIPSSPSHIAVIGNALPRRCGLATYTSHSVTAIKQQFPSLKVDHYAMDDGHVTAYGPDIAGLIPADDIVSYLDAARTIDESGASVIWVQHEFGIYGGSAGEHLLALLQCSKLPVVSTLHTVLAEPDAEEERVFRALLARSARLVVMAEHGRAILRTRYGIDDSRIAVIPHGAPDRQLADTGMMKARLGLPDCPLMMTFGLLAPDKGLEYAIAALPAIAAKVPDVCYAIVGATHPALRRHEGEAYRESLAALARQLGIEDRILFQDAFLDDEALLDRLQAADVYLTPYLNPQQITSGTLSFAVATGRPVVSTPYVHAAEVLADDHGILVPFRDSAAIAEACAGLLLDHGRRTRLSERAYARGRGTIWPRNADAVMAQLVAATREQAPLFHAKPKRQAMSVAVDVDLTAVERMTDNVGMIQHSVFGVPDRNHGYCLDDNARALMLVSAVPDVASRPEAARLTAIYAGFVNHAWDGERGRFRNFMGFDRNWLEKEGSEDSNGRGLWALGVVAARAHDPDLRTWAQQLFSAALPMAGQFGSPRAIAFAMLGASAFVQRHARHEEARHRLAEGAALLASLLEQSRRPDWPWFEAVLAYDNARLPEALIRAGLALGDGCHVALGLESLRWILAQQTAPLGHFRPVGTESFSTAYAPPRPFDQQPLEAAATLDACAAAHAADGGTEWLHAASAALGWFYGRNDLDRPLTGPHPGGCYDGLTPYGVNRNQGAESILALQMAIVTANSLALEGIESAGAGTTRAA